MQMTGLGLNWRIAALAAAAAIGLAGCDDSNKDDDQEQTTLAAPILSFVLPGESLDLANYTLARRHDLPVGTGVNKLAAEASGITWNKDTGTLFIVGDHGTSVVQVGRNGTFIDSMTLPAGTGPQGTAIYDPEGITWVQGSTFVLSEERDRKATRITYSPNTTADAAGFRSVTLGTFSPNLGNEGISYDPQTQGFIFVKEKTPQGVFQSSIDFNAGTASNGSASADNPVNLFNPDLLGAADLADVHALSNVLPATAGDHGHLLLLSQESGIIYKTSRSGAILSRLSIGIPPQHEGIAADSDKVIYVVNELGGGAGKPQLWVYEPTAGSNAVGTGSNLYLTFDRSIAAGTGDLTVSGGGDTLTIPVTDAEQVKISGSTLAINPEADLKPGVAYTVALPAGAIRAASGNASSPAVSMGFTTRQETVPPTLVDTSPAGNAVGVTSSHIVFTFSEPVKAGTGNIVISGSGADLRTIAITDTAQVSISGHTVDINPLADLNPGTSYSVEIPAGAVVDLSGNAFAGLTGASSLKFSTAGAGSSGPTPLLAGDVLFLAANADPVDAIGFVILKDVTAGTQIHFTDKDYSAASPTLWPTNEAAFTWTADVDYPAGTIVTIQTDTALLTTDKGVTTGISGGISTSNETYYAFQGTITDAAAGQILVQRFLAAINLGTAAGDIPAELTGAGAYLHFAEDNVKYTGSLDRSNLAAFAALAKNPVNWSVNDATAFALTDGSFFGAAAPPPVGGTELQAGDVLFLAINADPVDAIAFVILQNVVAGTQIHFTDKDYTSGAAWPTNEALITWTADVDYPAGTIVTIQTDSSALPADKGTTAGTSGGISTSNETYYAFQGSVSPAIVAARFLAAINVGTTAGDIPPELTGAGAYLHFAEDNVKYTGSLVRSNLATFATLVKNTANWSVNDTTAFPVIDNSLFGGTHLDAGDVLFMGINSSTPDALAFVIMKNVVAGTLIHFTDKDYSAASPALWPTNESAWTWMADVDYPAGTIVNIRPDVTPLAASVGTVFGSDGGVGGSETYYAFQGDIINAGAGRLRASRFLATIHVGASAAGDIPAGLGGSAISFSAANAKYTGSLDQSSLPAFADNVKNTANWTSQAGAFPLTGNSLFP